MESMIYNRILVNYANTGLKVSRYFDQGLIEIIGPLGFIRIFHYYAFLIESLGTGALYHYALIMFVSITIAILLSQFKLSLFLIFLLLFSLIDQTPVAKPRVGG